MQLSTSELGSGSEVAGASKGVADGDGETDGEGDSSAAQDAEEGASNTSPTQNSASIHDPTFLSMSEPPSQPLQNAA